MVKKQKKTAMVVQAYEGDAQALLAIDAQIDKDDIVAIAVCEAERRLQKELSQRREEISRLDDDLHHLNEEAARLGQAAAVGSVQQHTLNIVASLRALGLTVESKISLAQLPNSPVNGQELGPMRVKIAITNFHEFTVACPILPSGQLRDTLNAIYAAMARRSHLEAGAIECRRKLSSMATIERQMRAKLARAKLEETAAGQRILDAMLNNIDQNLLELRT